MPISNDLTAEERAEFTSMGADMENAPAPAPTPEPAPEPAPKPVTTAVPVTEPVVAASLAPMVADPNAPAPVVDPNAPPAPPPGFVPHAALHAERARANEAARAASVATARMNAMLEQQRASAAAAPVMPDLNTDPEGYITALESRLAGFEARQQETQEFRAVDSAVEADEASFTSYTPDYPQAMQHWIQSRGAELLHFNSREDVGRIMQGEVRQIAKKSWEAGVSPAQRIYEIAQSRGYVPGQPAPQAAAPVAAQPAPVGGPTAAAIVASVDAGQAASRSLSGGQGAAPASELNVEAILAMSDEEFAQHMKIGTKGADARFAQIAGR